MIAFKCNNHSLTFQIKMAVNDKQFDTRISDATQLFFTEMLFDALMSMSN